jgi:hypothetical protein
LTAADFRGPAHEDATAQRLNMAGLGEVLETVIR